MHVFLLLVRWCRACCTTWWRPRRWPPDYCWRSPPQARLWPAPTQEETMTQYCSAVSPQTLQTLTSMVHSRPACWKSVINVIRWSSSVTPRRVCWQRDRQEFYILHIPTVKNGGGQHHCGSRHRLVYVHFDSLTSVDPLNFALASLSDWKRHKGCSWWGDLQPIRGWFKEHVIQKLCSCLASFIPCDKIPPPSLHLACPHPELYSRPY